MAYQCSLLPCIFNPLKPLRCCFETQNCSTGVRAGQAKWPSSAEVMLWYSQQASLKLQVHER